MDTLIADMISILDHHYPSPLWGELVPLLMRMIVEADINGRGSDPVNKVVKDIARAIGDNIERDADGFNVAYEPRPKRL